MASRTQRLQIPYPSDGENPWYASLKAFTEGVDAHLFAATEDRNLLVLGGGTLHWEAGTGVLSWSDGIIFLTPTTGKLQTLAASQVTITHGTMMMVSLTRGATAAVTLSVAVSPYILAGATALLFAYRLGDTLYLRTGQRMEDGESLTLDGGTARVDAIESFTLDNETWEFELEVEPAVGTIAMVSLNGLILVDGYTLEGTTLVLDAYPVYVDVSGWVLQVRYQI